MLTIGPAPSLTFSADGPFAAALGDDGDANLVVRAARGLAAAVGCEPAVRLHLTKNLPVASGIGGGSTDAAACLRGLARLWEIDPASAAVREVAATLGADVPACLNGRACYMGGIGTELMPAPKLPPAGLLLVNPGIALSTPSVYKARRGEFSPPMRFDTAPADAAALAALLTERTNDLAAPAIALVPEIQAVLDAIAAVPGCLLARMSGSGATCFGRFDDAPAAAAAAGSMTGRDPGWWVAAGRLVEDARVLDAA